MRPLQSLFRLVLGERRARIAGTIAVESLRSTVPEAIRRRARATLVLQPKEKR